MSWRRLTLPSSVVESVVLLDRVSELADLRQGRERVRGVGHVGGRVLRGAQGGSGGAAAAQEHRHVT